jgi:hypothetical protein
MVNFSYVLKLIKWFLNDEIPNCKTSKTGFEMSESIKIIKN